MLAQNKGSILAWHKNIKNAHLENIRPQSGSHEVTAAKQSFKKWAREKSGLKEAFQSQEIRGFRTESCPLSIGIPCCTSYRYQWKLPQNMGRDWPCNFGCCLIWFSFPYACINDMYLFTKTYSVGTTHRFAVSRKENTGYAVVEGFFSFLLRLLTSQIQTGFMHPIIFKDLSF